MKLTVSQQIRIALPESTPRAVLHVLLTPRSGPSQTVREWTVTPSDDADRVTFADAFGNLAHLVTHARPPRDWVLRVGGQVETIDRHGVLGRMPGEPVPRLYLRQTALTRLPQGLADPFRDQAAGSDRVGLFHTLMSRAPAVFREATRIARASAEAERQPGGDKEGAGAPKPARLAQSQTQGQAQSQTPVLTAPASSTRPAAPDLAHTLIGLARELGFPARFVTGYLGRETASVPAMHAWAEIHDEGLGWIGFDPLLQLCPTDAHIRVACALDAHSAAPIRSVPAVEGAPGARLSIESAAA